MKTAREWVRENVNEYELPTRMEMVIKMMTEYAKYYHEQQVKSVDLDSVGGSLPNYSDDVNTESALNMGRTLDMGKQ